MIRRIATLAIVTLATACSGGSGSVDSTSSPSASPGPSASAATVAYRPAANDTLQVQYAGAFDTTVDAKIFDVDAFDTSRETVDALHAAGRRVLCYVNAGAYETYRTDAASFPAIVLGKTYVGYPQERWLDIRRIDLLAPIMDRRLDTCVAKGFDGVDPDNVDGFQNATGFPLTADDQLTYDRFVAREAHARGLAVGLKNDDDQVVSLVDTFDFAVTEGCWHQGSCARFSPFLKLGKPVFTIEYTDVTTPASFSGNVCGPAKASGFFPLLKRRELDAYRETCR